MANDTNRGPLSSPRSCGLARTTRLTRAASGKQPDRAWTTADLRTERVTRCLPRVRAVTPRGGLDVLLTKASIDFQNLTSSATTRC